MFINSVRNYISLLHSLETLTCTETSRLVIASMLTWNGFYRLSCELFRICKLKVKYNLPREAWVFLLPFLLLWGLGADTYQRCPTLCSHAPQLLCIAAITLLYLSGYALDSKSANYCLLKSDYTEIQSCSLL